MRAAGHIDRQVAIAALDQLEVDRFGLDEIDQKIMTTLLAKYSGGPVGVNTIAASIDEEADTIEEVYEPYLIQLGFIDRTPRGRVGTDRAFEYFQYSAERIGDSSRACFEKCYLSLGSNLGDRAGHLEEALDRLGDERGPGCCANRRFMKPRRRISWISPGF